MRCPTTGTHGNLRQLRCPLAIPHDGRHVWGPAEKKHLERDLIDPWV